MGEVESTVTIYPALFPNSRRYWQFIEEIGQITRTITRHAPARDSRMPIPKGSRLPAGDYIIDGQCSMKFFTQWCERNGLVFLNLYPDMSRKAYEANDTFVFAAPISIPSWKMLRAKAVLTGDGVAYLLPKHAPGLEDAVIILREKHHSDDDMLAAAAHVRVIDQCRHVVYCCEGVNLTQAQLIGRVAGAPRALSKMITIDEGDD